MSGGITVEYRRDDSLTGREDSALRRLLFSCFPHEPLFLSRRYLKERPLHRWLASDASGEIVAHCAVHDKVVGSTPGDFRIGGIAEVCVAAKYRRRGVVKQMLDAIHEWLLNHGIPFAVLFGQPKIYVSSGYRLVENEVRSESALLRKWNPFAGKPMVKCLTEIPWPAGTVDLRGPVW